MRRSLTSDMRRLRKTLTYLLTYLRDPLLDFGTLSVSLKRLKLITNIADYHKEHYQTHAKLGHRVMTGVRYSFLEFWGLLCIFETVEANNKYSMQIDHKEHYQTYAKLGHRVMTGVRYSFLEFYDAYIFGTFEGINSNLVRRCKIAYTRGD